MNELMVYDKYTIIKDTKGLLLYNTDVEIKTIDTTPKMFISALRIIDDNKVLDNGVYTSMFDTPTPHNGEINNEDDDVYSNIATL